MNTFALYNRMVLLTLILGIASYTVAAPAPLLALFAIPAAYVGWRLSGRLNASGEPVRLPALAVNLLLLAAIAFASYRAVTYSFEVSIVAELVIFIQLIKLGDRRTPRDDAQILYLSVFLAIAAMLTSNTLWVGLILAIFLPVLVAAVMLFQLHKGQIIAARSSPHPQKQPDPGPAFNGHFRRTAAMGAVGTLAAAFIVFIIMPRGIGENTLGSWGNPQRNTVTGFTDRVNLGTRGVISTSPTVVLDLTVREHSPDGRSYPLGSGETVHYLRGAVLDRYDGGVWLPSRGETEEIRHGIDLRAGEEFTIASLGGPLLEQTVTLRHTVGSDRQDQRGQGRRGPTTRLFSTWRPVKIKVQRDSRLRIHLANGIIERTGDAGSLTYTVWSRTSPRQPLMPRQRELMQQWRQRESGEEAQAVSQEPQTGLAIEAAARSPTSFESDAIHELASDILQEAGIEPDPGLRPVTDDSRAARAIQDYLRANFEYTLDEIYFPPEAHPIEYFLFEMRRGHCEYYASAMVAMCRSVGINSRIITGYVAAEFNQASGHYTVRESNAHAWVEAEAGRGNWQRFDPTPQSDLVRIHRPQRTILSRIRQMFDAVEFAWNTSIVGFDAGRREQLLQTSRMRESAFVQRLDSLTTGTPLGRQRKSSVSLLSDLLIVFVALALPAAGGFALWRWLKRGVSRRQRKAQRRSRRDPALDPPFFKRYLEVLDQRGHPKPAWSPPLEHAQRLPGPELSEPATDIARLYYESRFAGRTLTDDQLQQAQHLIDRLLTDPASNGQSKRTST